MKILIISQSFLPKPCGGAEIMVYQECDFLSKDYDVLLFTSRSCKNIQSYLKFPIKKYLPMTYLTQRFGWLGKFYLKWQLKVLQNRHNFDVWHIHFAFPFANIAVPLAKQLNIPSVVTCHGGDILINKSINYGYRCSINLKNDIQKTLLIADAVVAISKTMQNELLTIGVNQANVHLIPNGINIERFKKVDSSNVYQSYRCTKTDNIILCVGRNSAEKGQIILLDALQLLKNQGVHFVCIFVGQNIQALDTEINNRSLQNDVRLLDTIYSNWSAGEYDLPPNELICLYKISSVVIVPSLSEAFGLTALEAFASGSLVIASDIGGLKELVEHGKNGFLFPVNDSDALAYYIKKVLYMDNKLRCKLIAKSLLTAKKYSREIMMEKHILLFKKLRS